MVTFIAFGSVVTLMVFGASETILGGTELLVRDEGIEGAEGVATPPKFQH